jgi:hypothetical protein
MLGKGLICCLLVTALIAVANVQNARAQGRHRGAAGFGMGQGVDVPPRMVPVVMLVLRSSQPWKSSRA